MTENQPLNLNVDRENEEEFQATCDMLLSRFRVWAHRELRLTDVEADDVAGDARFVRLAERQPPADGDLAGERRERQRLAPAADVVTEAREPRGAGQDVARNGDSGGRNDDPRKSARGDVGRASQGHAGQPNYPQDQGQGFC